MSRKPVSTVCVKCGGTMELGLVASLPPWQMVRQPEPPLFWLRGTPKRSWLTFAYKVSGKDRVQVASLRCAECGYLEMYAPEATES